jgi:hypothetical protein
MSDDERDWSEQERARLDALEPEEPPPPGLEARVVAALRERGLVRDRRRLPWRSAAAALVALGIGVGVGRASRGPEPPPSHAREARTFMLLLYPGAGLDRSPGAEERRVQEYGRWARDLSRRGGRVTGEKLRPGTTALGVDAPEAADSLLGFFLIQAATRDEAEEIARSCPHRGHGGTIALREVDPT